MKRRLEFLWARSGPIQVSNLDNRLFLVRFAQEKDYRVAAFGGPWKIYDFYIAVAQWSPSFNEEDPFKSILTWVRLPKLPIQYFNQVTVERIGNYIGKTVRLDLLGMPLTQNLGKYLGVPILHERINVHTYQDILDKIDNKLAGWKVKSLSLAGRVTLAKSVLAAIPAYAMQTSVLPPKTCEAIDRRIRNFVWGTTAEARKISLVAWEKICLPKENGGLGLRMAGILNRAYLTKLAFTFFKDKERLWVRLLQHKYFTESGNEGIRQRRLPSKSPLWKGMSREWNTMLDGARSSVRDGSQTLFWTNTWVDTGIRLVDEADTSVEGFNIDSTVAEFTNADGQWDFDSINKFLPPAMVDLIAGMTPPHQDRGPDDWIWGCEKSGIFSIKSAYNLICRAESDNEAEKWKCVWKWTGPYRIRFFLWLAAKERLLTNAARMRRGFTQDASSPFCANNEESISHILRDCSFAAETWRHVGGVDIQGERWQRPYQLWLQDFIKSDSSLIFGITCWYLWRARNERIFTGSTESSVSVAFKCRRWRDTVQSAMERDVGILDEHTSRIEADIAWQAGRPGWITLNLDGSVVQRRAAAGGIVRDNEGRGLLAYSMNLGICSITRAELRGALEGIKRAWEAGYQRVEIQSDSKAAIDILIDNSAVISHSHAMEVLEFRDWLRRDWEIKIRHVYREANFAADYLASRGHSLPRGSHYFDLSDSRLAHLIRYDCMGISEPRMILIN
ncbi:Putative ribonuclease H protein At1g65750 [Linum perenne]